MIIDDLYTKTNKNNFYLGIVTQVYKNNCVCQIENLSWLKSRRINMEYLIPNTINFHVIIDSSEGIFIGEVYQSKIQNTDSTHYALTHSEHEKVFPEVSIDIIGIMKNGEIKFQPVGFFNVGLTDKVYFANSEVNKKYLESMELDRKSKEYCGSRMKLKPFAKVVNMSNQELNLYPETLFDRHLLAIGATNSGKSTSSLSIIDKLIKADKKVLVIDPTGEYSDSFSDDEVKKMVLGIDTILDPGKVSFSQWATLFETNDSSQPAVLADAIRSLRFQKKHGKDEVYKKSGKTIVQVLEDMESLLSSDLSFNLALLPLQITEEAVEVDRNMTKYQVGSFQFNNKQWLVQKVKYKLESASLIDFFSASDNKDDPLGILNQFMNDDIKSVYINASKIGIGEGIGSMIVDLVSNYIVNNKKKDDVAFVIFVDEVHRYSKDVQAGGYQTGLTAIAREGRKKGIFLFLTTQNPKDIPDELLGQIGSLLVHRLTHKSELDSIRNYMSESSFKQVSRLNQGESILTSINLLEDLHLAMDECIRIHHKSTIQL